MLNFGNRLGAVREEEVGMTIVLSRVLGLLDDPVRIEAYARAIEKVVKPGMRVVDVLSGEQLPRIC